MTLEVALFPCLSDNYGFLLHSPDTGETAAIDTPDAKEIAKQCEARGWRLTEIWNTHWHPDHAGGNVALKRRYDCTVKGPEQAAIPARDITLSGGDTFEFAGHPVDVIHTPGHTDEHIIYHIPSAEIAFVGDTVFALGCGRLFEGTPEHMWGSLSRIASLPEATKLYCAHEYTLPNAKFAVMVDGDNPDLRAAIADAEAKRAAGLPTVPTSVGVEKRANPFITAGSAEELGRRRALKDNF